MRKAVAWPVVAAVFTGLQVGAAIVASRYVIEQTTPATLAMLRYSIGFLCLLPAVLIFSRRWFQWRDVMPIALLGVLQFGVLIALLNYALQYMPSARAALIFATVPLQTMVLAAVFGREAITWSKTIAVLLTIAGIACALGEDLFQEIPGEMEGIAAIAVGLSAFTGAICSIFYQPYLQRYPAQNVSSLAMLASVGALLIYSGLEDGLQTIPEVTTAGWAAVIFIGISSGAGYFAWLWALKHLSPTRVTLFLSLGPISSAILGNIFLAEPVSIPLVLGISLVIAGLVLGLKKQRV